MKSTLSIRFLLGLGTLVTQLVASNANAQPNYTLTVNQGTSIYK